MTQTSLIQQKFSTLLIQSMERERKGGRRLVFILYILSILPLIIGVMIHSYIVLGIGLLFVFMALIFYNYSQKKYRRKVHHWQSKHLKNRNSILWVKPEITTSFGINKERNQAFTLAFTLYTAKDFVGISLANDDDYVVFMEFLFIHSPIAHCGSSYTALRHFEVDTANFIDNLKKDGHYTTVFDWFKDMFDKRFSS